MAFKTRRQNRYAKLRKAGFLKFEARDLSKIPLKVPYMLPLMRQRFKDYKKAVKADWTISQWEKYIQQDYKQHKWLDSHGKYSPWAMLRDAEEGYRTKHPNYASPWQKKRGQMRDFIRTFEKEVAKLPVKRPITPDMKARMDRQQQEMNDAFKHIKKMREEGVSE